jgi:hypothetical protein
MGRPPKPKHLRRSKIFHVRFTPSEMQEMEQASRKLGESVASILRRGAALYVKQRGKDGSGKHKEEKR